MTQGIRDQSIIEDRVTALITRLSADFDLGWVTIHNRFDPKTDDRVICATLCDWEYRQASFTWSLPQLAIISDEDLELCAIHEIVHVLNASVWESLTPKEQDRLGKLNEYSTENISRVIAHLYKGSYVPSQK